MSGAVPPLPNTPSWRDIQLKNRNNFTIIVIIIIVVIIIVVIIIDLSDKL
jgi:uncharacterized Tic20 family protein